MSNEVVKQVPSEDAGVHQKARSERFRLTNEPEKAGMDKDNDRSPAEKAFPAEGSSAAIQQHDAGQLNKGGHPGFHAEKKGKK